MQVVLDDQLVDRLDYPVGLVGEVVGHDVIVEDDRAALFELGERNRGIARDLFVRMPAIDVDDVEGRIRITGQALVTEACFRRHVVAVAGKTLPVEFQMGHALKHLCGRRTPKHRIFMHGERIECHEALRIQGVDQELRELAVRHAKLGDMAVLCMGQ